MNALSHLSLQSVASQLPALLEIVPDDVIKDVANLMMTQCQTGDGWDDHETLLSLQMLIELRLNTIDDPKHAKTHD